MLHVRHVCQSKNINVFLFLQDNIAEAVLMSANNLFSLRTKENIYLNAHYLTLCQLYCTTREDAWVLRKLLLIHDPVVRVHTFNLVVRVHTLIQLLRCTL